MHIPLLRIVKIKFLAHYPVDHIPHRAVFSLLLVIIIIIIIIIIATSWEFFKAS